MGKVIILVGSATEKSRSLHLGERIGEALTQRGHDIDLMDLRTLKLPHYDVSIEATKTYDEKTQTFLDKSHAADGFVWVTPVYHNSFSSLLKTALDWQHDFYFDNKVLGVASHAGPDRSPAAADQLLMVARSQHYVHIPTRVFTKNVDYNEQKILVDKDILERIERFAVEFDEFLARFHK